MSWSKMMGTVLPCGHTNAQHMYATEGALEFEWTPLCKREGSYGSEPSAARAPLVAKESYHEKEKTDEGNN